MKMPKFITYIQNHKVDILPNFVASHPTFHLDGVAEMYWHTEKDMLDDFDSSTGIDILRQDESEFMSNISVCIVEEEELEGEKTAIKIMMCLGHEAENINIKFLKQSLPHSSGLQKSTVIKVMSRPHLPELSNVPNIFISIWFDTYEDVLTDFESDLWKKYYQSDMREIDRLSLDIFNPIFIRSLM